MTFRTILRTLTTACIALGALVSTGTVAAQDSNAPWNQLTGEQLRTQSTRNLITELLNTVSVDQLRAAAERGDSTAQYFYGYALKRGLGGLTANADAGYPWSKRSCEAGNPRGCMSEAYNLLAGEGVERNPALALKRFRSACEDQIALACGITASLVANDANDIPANPELAIYAYERACIGGNVPSCEQAGNRYRDEASSRPNPKDSFEYALDMYARGCERDGRVSCFRAARLIEANPRHFQQPFSRVETFYRKSCDLELSQACYNLGVIHNEGKLGQPVNNAKATALMDEACTLGYADACYNLGSWFIDGRAGRKDGRRAIELLGPLCLRDKDPDIQACNNAGTAAYRGSAMPAPDYDSARKFYERACSEGGLVASCRTLSDMYRDGQIRESALGEREWLDAQLCFKANEQEYCRPETRQYVILLRAGEGNFPSAANVAGNLCQEGDFAACRTESLLKACQANSATRSACRRAFSLD